MDKQLDVLFLGRLFPKQKGPAIRQKARVDMQDAANVLQWNLINGMLENGVKHIHVVSFLPIDSWPKHYRAPFVSHAVETYDERCSFETVGFCNITCAKQILAAHACDGAVRKWAKQDNGAKKVIVCYSENNVLMRAVAAAKKANPQIESVQVIADITEFATNANLNKVRQMFIDSQIKENKKNRSFIDRFVLLTRQMQEKLEITKPYMVMEGIVPPWKPAPEKADSGEKTVLYTGSMNTKYGILTLLEGFTKIPNEDYRLLLCGLGNAEPIIKEYCEGDSRITFLGKVPHEQVLQLQQEATVLVNPRQNNEEFTKYSFPSKTMEYLASGVPVVAYKLDGIPDEYDEYLNYVEDNSADSLAAKLMQICELDEAARAEMGKRGAEFVLQNKNAVVQTRRILEFIENHF